MVNVIIDEFTPCLKDARTGELVQTEVIRIRRKTFLKKYNKKAAGMWIGHLWQMKMKYMRW